MPLKINKHYRLNKRSGNYQLEKRNESGTWREHAYYGKNLAQACIGAMNRIQYDTAGKMKLHILLWSMHRIKRQIIRAVRRME